MRSTIVELEDLVLEPSACECWRNHAEVLRRQLGGGGQEVVLPPMQARLVGNDLYLFVRILGPSGGSFTFELAIAPSEWKWKGAAH